MVGGRSDNLVAEGATTTRYICMCKCTREGSAMKRLRVVFLGTLTAVLVLGLSAAIVAGQGDTSPVPGPLASRTGVSGPIEQGDTGYWRSPYLPTGKWGVSGPVEQGDSGFWRVLQVGAGRTGISGPIEQGDTGYWRSPYLPTGRWGVSGPVEQGDSAFWRAFHVPVGKTGISGPIEQDMFGW